MFQQGEMRFTKEDWVWFLALEAEMPNLTRKEIDKRIYDHFLPKSKAIYSSDELLDWEKEENLLTYSQYMQSLREGGK